MAGSTTESNREWYWAIPFGINENFDEDFAKNFLTNWLDEVDNQAEKTFKYALESVPKSLLGGVYTTQEKIKAFEKSKEGELR